jgi:hypothetical protein
MTKKKLKTSKKKSVKSPRGAWGYDVDSAEFVDKLRKGKKIEPI